MEIVDNAILLAVPGAMEAGLSDPLFWGSLAVALAVAFVVTVPGQPGHDRPRTWTRGGPPVPPLTSPAPPAVPPACRSSARSPAPSPRLFADESRCARRDAVGRAARCAGARCRAAPGRGRARGRRRVGSRPLGVRLRRGLPRRRCNGRGRRAGRQRRGARRRAAAPRAGRPAAARHHHHQLPAHRRRLPGRAADRPRGHGVLDGAGPPDLPRAVDGRPLLAGPGRRLPLRAGRRRTGCRGSSRCS